jgi:serine/threonine protein phosphatase PrpC
MGDCRAYHFSWELDEDSGKQGCRVKALTRDNNTLTSKLMEVEENEDQESFELMKNELLELSRQLKLYMGISNDENFAQEIARQTISLELDEDDALLLMTDGMYMPIVRHNIANTNFHLTMDMHYLEDWFALYIDNGNYLLNHDGVERWDALARDIRKSCIKYTNTKHRYRDDMAVIVTN